MCHAKVLPVLDFAFSLSIFATGIACVVAPLFAACLGLCIFAVRRAGWLCRMSRGIFSALHSLRENRSAVLSASGLSAEGPSVRFFTVGSAWEPGTPRRCLKRAARGGAVGVDGGAT